MCRRTVYSITGKAIDMSDDHSNFKRVLASIGLCILVSLVYAGIFEDWLDDYLSDEFSPFYMPAGLILFFLGAFLYLGHEEEQARKKERKVYHWFSKETHELWNSMDTKGKAVYVFGWIVVTIIGVVLAWYALIFSVGSFFSQVP